MSIQSLIAGLIFGICGVYLLKAAKTRANLYWVPIGVGLIGYTYFVSNPFLLWGIGSLLLFLAYLTRYA